MNRSKTLPQTSYKLLTVLYIEPQSSSGNCTCNQKFLKLYVKKKQFRGTSDVGRHFVFR